MNHVHRARAPRGKGLRSKAAKRRKGQIGGARAGAYTPTRSDSPRNERTTP